MDLLSDDIRRLMGIMRSSMTTDDIFFHVMNQIARKIPKLQRLRQDEYIPGQFNEEVAEMAILVAMLRDIGGVSDFVLSNKIVKIIEDANKTYGKYRE
ncbi:MAG: hypothetical protein KKC05_04215 [Nanoarchaeota archaeon]|nr:hypothetical protein [Nanoarchaeota archaeon]